MKYMKPLTPSRFIHHICLAFGFGSIFIAALATSPAPMTAVKADPSRSKSIQSPTPDPCAAPNPPPQTCGKWEMRKTLKTVPVHISVLPDKRLLYWGRDKHVDHFPNGDHWDVGNRSFTYVWDLSDSTGGLPILNNTTNLFCSSHSFTLDGRLLVVGGHTRNDSTPSKEAIGETDVNIFDPGGLTWTQVGSMSKGRWYPSSVTLGTGETVIAAGTYWDGVKTVNGVPDTDPNKGIDKFTLGLGIQNFSSDSSPQLWSYPYLHLAPDGKVFIAGPGPDPSRYFDATNFTQPPVDGPVYHPPTHYDGSALVYDGQAGKVMMVGGISGVFASNEQTVTTTQTIDLSSATPIWKSSAANPPQVAAMKRNRRYHYATVLPDGKVLVTGGTQCGSGPAVVCKDNNGNIVGTAVTRPEIWTPNGKVPDGEWRLLASSPVYSDYPNGIPRSYHSIALLLPDARVLVGGGGLPAAGGEFVNGTECKDVEGPKNTPDCLRFGHKDVEIFSPPYLFNADGTAATQPVILGSVGNVDKVIYGQTVNVNINSPLPITSVALIRLPSVTHSSNFDQRRVVLQPTPTSSTTLSVTIPADNRILPPGPYMMFILDSNGVPSKARIIRVNQFDGMMEAINCNQIRGWAWDLNQPNTPINVTLNFTGFGVQPFSATVTANQFRQDLLNAGKGNGQHGFVFNIPLALKDGANRLVTTVYSGTKEMVPRHFAGALQCPASLFPAQIPTGTASGEGQTWEQGTQFSSSVGGRITHIGFYKAEGETGTHVGRIWSDTGTLLASVTFTNETPSGWQWQILPTSLPVSAGVKYRVTYNINTLGAKIFAGLNTPITNGPLTAHTSYFSTPAGSFPTTNSGSILFADIGFAQNMLLR